MPRPSVTPSNRATTTAAVTGAGGPRGGVGGREKKPRQTMNGIDIQQNNHYDEKQQNGSENVPPPARGETKQSTIPPEKMETVSKGTGASKFCHFLKGYLTFVNDEYRFYDLRLRYLVNIGSYQNLNEISIQFYQIELRLHSVPKNSSFEIAALFSRRIGDEKERKFQTVFRLNGVVLTLS